MGFVPPPLQLTSEEFNKRWEAGARTLEELDPEFAKWLLSGPVGFFSKLFKTKTYKKLHEPLQ